MPTRVKICGITTWDDARLSIDLGASALGFNFYPPSPRAISPADAWSIIRRLPPFVEVVGVFVNWPPLVVDAMARALRLGSVELHGGGSAKGVGKAARKHGVIKAVQVKRGFRAASLARYGAADAILLDGFARGLHGGTGRTLDWKSARAAMDGSSWRAASRLKISPRPFASPSRTPWMWQVASKRGPGARIPGDCA